jgi:hypothetical protein
VKHKVGDRVRIQFETWIEANKDEHGDPCLKAMSPNIYERLKKYAGRTATITGKGEDHDDYYLLDIDDGKHPWRYWMFDPGYRPDEPLSPEDALRAMLDGETLVTAEGHDVRWREDIAKFERTAEGVIRNSLVFVGLSRRPEKRKRSMTLWEVLAWASSEESHGWLVVNKTRKLLRWVCPQYFEYSAGFLNDYQRAKLLPDLSGIDESTIQGFEVEA